MSKHCNDRVISQLLQVYVHFSGLWSSFPPNCPCFLFLFYCEVLALLYVIKIFFQHTIYLWIYLCVCVCLYTVHITAHIWRSDVNLESVLCSHHVGAEDWTHTARPGSKLLYLQVISHLRYTDFNRWKSGPPVFCVTSFDVTELHFYTTHFF